jgi:hypothetical protein
MPRLIAVVMLAAILCACGGASDGSADSSGEARPPEVPAPHPELRLLNTISGQLHIELTIPAERIPNTANLRAVPEARIVAVKLEPTIFERNSRTFRAPTAEELASIAFRAPQIRLRGKAGVVIKAAAPNGEYFTVAQMLAAIEDAELLSRNQTEWFGGVDIHHTMFAGLQANSDGTWSILWES